MKVDIDGYMSSRKGREGAYNKCLFSIEILVEDITPV